MPEIQTKKPILKKADTLVQEEAMADKMSSLVKEIKAEEVSKVETPVVETVEKPVGPRKYRCKTQCWTNKRVYEVGEIETFQPGQFVSEHFEPIE